MAKGVENYPNIDTSDLAAYPNGIIKDTPNGTPVNVLTNSDIHSTLDKLLRYEGATANNLPDNETNGYQYLKALLQVLPNKYVWETTTNGDGDLQTLSRADIQAAVAMAGTTSAVGAADFGRPIDGATLDKLLDWNIAIWVKFFGTSDWVSFGVGNNVTNLVRISINSGGDIEFYFNIAPLGDTADVRVVLIG